MKLRVFLLALLLALFALPAILQAQGRVVIVDEPGELDQGAIQSAAQPLVRRGAAVAVYLLDSASQNECNAQLEADGLRRSDGLFRNELVAVCVGMNRYSVIVNGDEWNDALNRSVQGQRNAELIRQEVLNPQLSNGDFTAAYVDTLGAVEEAIVSPPSENPVDTAPIGWALGGAAVLGVGAAVGVPAIRRRRRAALALKTAREAAEDARRKTGAAIAETGQLLKTVNEKAAYDKVSYPPAEIARLKELMDSGQAEFKRAQTRFDDLGESIEGKKEVKQQEYEQLTEAYTKTLQQVEQSRARLAESEKIRAELDALRQQANNDLDRLKKA